MHALKSRNSSSVDAGFLYGPRTVMNTSDNEPDYVAIYGTERLVEFSSWYAGYHGYISILVCVFGIICNGFNIVVLTRKEMISSTNYILTGLAVSDLLTMASYVPFALQFYCIHGLEPSPTRNSWKWVMFMQFHFNFTVTTHTISILLGVMLAIFRYVYLRLASDGQSMCSIPRTKFFIGLVYLISIIILIPTFISTEIVPQHNEFENQTYYDIVPLSGETGNTLMQWTFWIHALAIKIIPCLLMSIFGFLLICTMRSTQRRGESLRKRSFTSQSSRSFKNRERGHCRTTRMLLVVIILFLITELPQGVLALLSGVMEGAYVAIYIPLGDLMDIVALINNSVNFILYCSMSKQFRDTFIQLICCRKTGDPDGGNVSLINCDMNLVSVLSR